MSMPNDTGRGLVFFRNPANGAFDSFNWDSTNNPTFDDSDEEIVLSYVCETEYWGNPLRGSTIPSVKLDRTGTTAQLQAAAENALQPAVDARQIRSFTVQVKKRAPGSFLILINYQNKSGHQRVTRLALSS